MATGTHWTQVTHGLSRFDQCIWIGQVGGDGQGCGVLVGPNALIGQQRCRLATTMIPGRDGDITLKIGEGGLMRDPLMVALF